MRNIDAWALLWMLGLWLGYTFFANHQARTQTCLASVLLLYRKQWMLRLLKRENRIADASLLDQLRSSASFFASTSMLVIAGLVTCMTSSDEGLIILSYLPLATTNTHELWEYKMLVMAAIFIYAFFEFSWSLRLYNYVAVVIGSAPLVEEIGDCQARTETFSETSAKIISMAAKHFNYGLRAYYFSLATLSWFVSVWCYLLLVTGIVILLYHREFHSKALKILSYSRMNYPKQN